MRYIEAKKLVNHTITTIISNIEQQYDEDEREEFLLKYHCKSLRDVIHLLICQEGNPNIDITSLELIQEIEDELYKYSFSLSRAQPQIDQAEKQRDVALSELKKVNQLIERYNEKSAIIETQFNIYEMVLRNNNLSLEKEAKKLNLKPINKENIDKGLGL